jgi:hypothetical protein
VLFGKGYVGGLKGVPALSHQDCDSPQVQDREGSRISRALALGCPYISACPPILCPRSLAVREALRLRAITSEGPRSRPVLAVALRE